MSPNPKAADTGGAADIVNAYFRRFYPVGERTNETYQFEGDRRGGFRYCGPEKVDRIFPNIVCADGLKMSVQAHYGAYCYPNDDFCEDPYSQVEIMAAPKLDPQLEPFEREHNAVGEEMIYPYVPVTVVVALIEKHGGLVGQSDALIAERNRERQGDER